MGIGVTVLQVGATWTARGVVSLSMSGDLNLLDDRTPGDKPALTLSGIQKGITAGEFATPAELLCALLSSYPGAVVDAKGTFIAASYDGRAVAFDSSTGKAEPVPGSGHSGQVSLSTQLAIARTHLFAGCRAGSFGWSGSRRQCWVR
jgi:hypothetical protein